MKITIEACRRNFDKIRIFSSLESLSPHEFKQRLSKSGANEFMSQKLDGLKKIRRSFSNARQLLWSGHQARILSGNRHRVDDDAGSVVARSGCRSMSFPSNPSGQRNRLGRFLVNQLVPAWFSSAERCSKRFGVKRRGPCARCSMSDYRGIS